MAREPKQTPKAIAARAAAEARRDPTKDRAAHEAARNVSQGSKSAIGRLSREELSNDEFVAALNVFRKESDRAAAIMGAALVENALIEALKSVIENDEDPEAIFYDRGAPFGTLKNKTVVVYALGLCDKKLANDIDLIRLIRNQFSHALKPIDFQHRDIAATCKELSPYAPLKLYEGPKPDPKLPRFRFESACTGIWIILMKKAAEIREKRIRELRAKQNALLDSAAGLSEIIASGLQSSTENGLNNIDTD